MKQNRKISVTGLGYVGLPVAVAFGKHNLTIGYDINLKRIKELKKGFDATGEMTPEQLKNSDILFTDNLYDLKSADFHIIAVPTPIDQAKKPDMSPLFKASEGIGKILKKGDIVVYESTVYPGATEEDCVPILEKHSNLKNGSDFTVGYSPERINPGDKKHTFDKIKKIVSGQDSKTLEIIAEAYQSVVTAGVYRASNIKIAEAAKIIENTQRDINIALMNEIALIFDKIGINTNQVLEASKTKWNFLPFKPGLVGGHCIGVDPYYLTHKAEKLGYTPQVILAGRRLNDEMGKFIAKQAIKKIIAAGNNILKSSVTVLGVTFKENCPDIRNSKVIDIIEELNEFGIKVTPHDPYADRWECKKEYDIDLSDFSQLTPASCVIIAVEHDQYKKLPIKTLFSLVKKNGVIIDVKGIFDSDKIIKAGYIYWSL